MSLVTKAGCLLYVLCYACSPINSLHSSTAPGVNSNVIFSDHETFFRNDIPIRAVREVMSRLDAVKNVSWQKRSSGGWLATCAAVDSTYKFYFDASGNWTAVWINYEEAPAYIKNIVSKSFNGYCIRNVYSVVLATDSKNVMFSVLINKGENSKVLKLSKGELTIFSEFNEATIAVK